MRGWFVADIIAVFPWLVRGRIDIEYLLRLVRTLKLGRAMNMLDDRGLSKLLVSLKTATSREKAVTVNYDAKTWVSLGQMTVTMLLVCYGMACFWFWYVKQVDSEEYSHANFLEDSTEHLRLDGESGGSQLLRS
jgi:hypothetical protein